MDTHHQQGEEKMGTGQEILKLSQAQRDALEYLSHVWKTAPAGVKSVTLLALEGKKLAQVRPRTHWNPDPWNSYSWQWRLTRKGERAAGYERFGR
jgi:hypothetical protein